MRRRKAREVALQILFSAEAKENPSALLLVEAYFKNFAPSGLEQSCDVIYLETLLSGILKNRNELDNLIAKHSENWRMQRMPPVDRNILRIGVQEILHSQDVPRKSAIDESVELAKKFGTEDSSAFINGILDKIQPQESHG